ncbi:hypothetical protein CROQUDRAFT_35292 [Cronartium quercuum f. sp. fusiforme G11]|uniref:proline--tRNA ligase n=1 Tax=Cronartium quercuum f. sp. fusiforme G11 TaxID=708437 RepID=A0A9P6THU8_9BASI|nr:hypothetical protein CROQUDRAFT_35292 [Cronartium quercuum f. sp. fusiforme G11]
MIQTSILRPAKPLRSFIYAHLQPLPRYLSSCRTASEPVYQSTRYTPTLKSQVVPATPTSASSSSAHALLLRAGFLRQSSTGIWNFLPNAMRVLNKLEKIVREEMVKIGASEVSLSHVQPSTLWKASGRWDAANKELFRLSDRKGTQLLLAPTHEEEITQLVKQDLVSSKQLPVRLFHIGRKYRDELRPRAGLLRSREFIMKDLYTFDDESAKALETYSAVQGAYKRIFGRIGLPFVVAEADSGAIGGSRSHEYQFESPSGEDTVIKCSGCNYMANIELARSVLSPPPTDINSLRVEFFQACAGQILLVVILPHRHPINPVKLAKIYPGALELKIDGTSLLADLDDRFEKMEVVIDESCMAFEVEELYRKIEDRFLHLSRPSTVPDPSQSPFERSLLSIWSRLPTYSVHDVRQVLHTSQTPTSGSDLSEHCPKCRSLLRSSKAIEVAHTFYLGAKYSNPLGATFQILDPETGLQTSKPFEMGCYGIGISRLLGAIAECGHREAGLRWPMNVAPFKLCIIIPSLPEPNLKSAAEAVARSAESVVGLEGDVLIDDRNQRVGWKLMDADLVGYPIVVLLGNRWVKDRIIEIKDVNRGKVVVLENVEFEDGRLVDEDRLIGVIGSLVQALVV